MSEEEELATEKQVKMYAALLHRLAETNKRDYKEMREEVKDMFGFSNAAKLKKSEMSEIITKLMEWIRGGEGAKVIDGDCDKEELTIGDEYEDLELNSEYTEEENEEKKEENEEGAKDAQYSQRMQWAIREAVRITLEEVQGKVENQGLAGFIKDIAIALFREERLEKKEEGE
jgi:hypothetical protein